MNLKQQTGCERRIVRDPVTGAEIQAMTRSQAHDIHGYYDTDAWSPNNAWIAFSSIAAENLAPEKGSGSRGGCLFVMRDDGSGLKRLNLVGPEFGHPSWHPDGRRVLYCDTNPVGDGRIYFLADRDGYGRAPVWKEPLGGHPIFNPQGTAIVDFIDKSILHLDLASATVTRLASYTRHIGEGLHAHPCWSRDGTKIICHSDHEGSSRIYVIELDNKRGGSL